MAKAGVLALTALICFIPMTAHADAACGGKAFGSHKVKPCPDRGIGCFLVYPRAPVGDFSADSHPLKRGAYMHSEFGPHKGTTAPQWETIGFDVDSGYLLQTGYGLASITKLTDKQLSQLVCLADRLWETDPLNGLTMEGTHVLSYPPAADAPDMYRELVLKDGDAYEVYRDSALRKGTAGALLDLMEKIADACALSQRPSSGLIDAPQTAICGPGVH